MAHPAQLNLPPILAANYEGLRDHPKSTFKAYYNRPEVQDRVLTVYTNALKKTVPKTAASGGLVGLAASWVFGLGIPGTLLSAAGGVAAGTTAGVAYETRRLAMDIRLDGTYSAWKASIEQPILDNFHEVLENYESFQNLRCQITHDFPAIAVRDAFGRVYDQESIYRWIDDHKTHPFTRERMAREDVTLYAGYANNLQESMEAAFGSPIFSQINTENSEEVIKGLKKALETIIANHNEIILGRAQQILDEARADRRPNLEAQRLFIEHLQGLVRLPEQPEAQPVGLMAIITAESSTELKEALMKETPLAISSVASRIIHGQQAVA